MSGGIAAIAKPTAGAIRTVRAAYHFPLGHVHFQGQRAAFRMAMNRAERAVSQIP
jgi:hypothetical protein